MIGPLFRSPAHRPRSTSVVPSRRRRFENVANHVLEVLAAPFGLWRLKRLVVERSDLALRDLAPSFDGYRIAFLTDPHYSAVVPRWWIARGVAEALALQPDLILLGGDFLSHSPRYAAGLTELFGPLAAPDGVYYVLGNHDHYVGAELVRRALAGTGLVELRNRAVLLRRGGGALALGGVGDLRYDVVDFEATLAGVPESVPRIVLSHDPDVFAFWPRAPRLDLMVSGHTHGGQAHLPFFGPPYVPSQFGFRYLAGRVEEHGRQLYVSRGLGVITAPVRWRCPPELTLLVLHPS
ncbi:MAG TPA: metallophosphoesterase [Candidatus Methylomirabilis sp.]|nr:metallophosphoesterase [Candidatus Methylomirabilis sp.]